MRLWLVLSSVFIMGSMTTNQTQPQTLQQMAGAPSTPPPFANSALILIDVQREYLDGHLPLPDIESATNNIAVLLSAAREASLPVIHIAHLGQAGGLFDPDAGGKIIDQVAPLDNELIITKTKPNSFAETELQEELSKLGNPSLILCGFMTHMCVSSTARAAFDLGLATTVVTDATATRALPGPDDGPAIDHTQLHRSALAALSDSFSILVTTAAIVG